MKKKKAKAKKQKVKKEVAGYPQQLQLEEFFKCPIWFADEPKFVDSLNKASDKYIEESKKTLKPSIDKRNKKFGDKGDMGHVFHSTTLIGDPNFNELTNYIGATSENLLNAVFHLSAHTASCLSKFAATSLSSILNSLIFLKIFLHMFIIISKVSRSVKYYFLMVYILTGSDLPFTVTSSRNS